MTPDNKPVSARLVRILVNRVSIGQPTGYTKVYPTDTRGAAYVTIPPFIGHRLQISVSGYSGYRCSVRNPYSAIWHGRR